MREWALSLKSARKSISKISDLEGGALRGAACGPLFAIVSPEGNGIDRALPTGSAAASKNLLYTQGMQAPACKNNQSM